MNISTEILLEQEIYKIFNLYVVVEYGNVDNLGKWFYIKRKNNGYYRLGSDYLSCLDYLKMFSKIDFEVRSKYLPSDIILV